MKIYKHWSMAQARVSIGAEEKTITCYGGSNASEAEARLNAHAKIEQVKNKIGGDRQAFENYEVEIREEITRTVNARAIVTRNRYGAEVLNVQDLMILDIDQPKPHWSDVFRRKDDRQSKNRIVEMVRALARKPAYAAYGFRLYETYKGVRAIVLGQTFDPQASATSAMMRDFNCDPLYTQLCHKQACFRARLTPKPVRLNLRGYKVAFPRTGDEEQRFQKWLAEYEAARGNFSACAFMENLGAEVAANEVVRVHDEMSGAHRNHPLA